MLRRYRLCCRKGAAVGELLVNLAVGAVAGVFSAGAIWGVLRTELRYMRRDLDEVRTVILKGVIP